MTTTMRIFVSLAVLTAAACGDELTPGSLIDRERVLGVRAEVVGEPDRAWPAPGESVDLVALVEAPEQVRPLAWALAPCLAGEPVAGVPTCAAEPLTVIEGSGPEVRARIDVPAAEQLGDAWQLAVVGVICAGGQPVIAEHGHAGCDGDGAVATPVVATITLMLDQANLNPSLADGTVQLAGTVWPPAPAQPMTGCADGELLQVAIDPALPVGDQELVIGIEMADAAREIYTTLEGEPEIEVERRERLQLSHFVTAGELASQYSVVDSDAERTAAEVEWTPPELDAIPEDGLRVRFTVVARDLRGGVGWTSRELCAVR
jgi:hypothetical protein